MVTGVLLEKRLSPNKEMSREVQKKIRESVSDLRPPSTLSTNHVHRKQKCSVSVKSNKSVYCLGAAVFVSEPERLRSMVPCRTI